MALDIGAIREALAGQIKTAINSGQYPANVYGYPPDSPALNAIMVFPRATEGGYYARYHETFGDTGALCRHGWRIEIRTGGGQVDAAQAMDAYLSNGTASSIVDALLADVSLGGVVEAIAIEGATVPGWFAPADGEARTWLMSQIDIDTRARR